MLWHFLTHKGTKTFGPYPDLGEASEAFQRVYGYWPGHLEHETTTYRPEDYR